MGPGGAAGRNGGTKGKHVIDYLRDGAEIYRHSFATIREEADLAILPDDVAGIAVRMIHACGMVDLVDDLRYTLDVVESGRAALELWRDKLPGSVVAIGNAPTALFRLLEILDEGVGAPAAIIGVPVGFVGAVESKVELAKRAPAPYLVVHGRRGGSAIAVAAINALASAAE